MDLVVHLDENGLLPDRFGKYCAPEDREGGHMSRRSFPFVLNCVPYGTRALAWVFLDWDSVPVCGFPWIHWCGYLADVDDVGEVMLREDASRLGYAGMVEGHNSERLPDGSFGCGYVGPCPPDRDHTYTLHVVALDAVPELPAGRAFWANELVAACRGHVLGEAVAQLPSRS